MIGVLFAQSNNFWQITDRWIGFTGGTISFMEFFREMFLCISLKREKK
jgi:hypothetical protein